VHQRHKRTALDVPACLQPKRLDPAPAPPTRSLTATGVVVLGPARDLLLVVGERLRLAPSFPMVSIGPNADTKRTDQTENRRSRPVQLLGTKQTHFLVIRARNRPRLVARSLSGCLIRKRSQVRVLDRPSPEVNSLAVQSCDRKLVDAKGHMR
jgi:hypothetical protein